MPAWAMTPSTSQRDHTLSNGTSCETHTYVDLRFVQHRMYVCVCAFAHVLRTTRSSCCARSCRVELGRALAKMGQKEAALQELKQAVTLEEEDINAHLQKVCCRCVIPAVTGISIQGSAVQPSKCLWQPTSTSDRSCCVVSGSSPYHM